MHKEYSCKANSTGFGIKDVYIHWYRGIDFVFTKMHRQFCTGDIFLFRTYPLKSVCFRKCECALAPGDFGVRVVLKRCEKRIHFLFPQSCHDEFNVTKIASLRMSRKMAKFSVAINWITRKISIIHQISLNVNVKIVFIESSPKSNSGTTLSFFSEFFLTPPNK